MYKKIYVNNDTHFMAYIVNCCALKVVNCFNYVCTNSLKAMIIP